MKKTIIISLGGSIINPGVIPTEFLKKFKEFILKFIKKDYRFVIVAGGGKICREYQKAAGQITKLNTEDQDWLGIEVTKLNAFFLKTIFKDKAYPEVLDSPQKVIKNKSCQLFIAAGWRPGCSTDYDSVLLSKRFRAKKIINASNVEYICDKDPAKFKDAQPIKKISWPDYLKIVGSKWTPGMHFPFDPVASKAAAQAKMTVVFTKGNDLQNLANILTGKKFKGTIIT